MSTQSLNFSQLAKYLKPEAGDDFNRFLDSVPDHVGKAALIAAGIAWASAAGLGLFTMIKTQELAAAKAELDEKQAVKPSVPSLNKVSAKKSQIEALIKDIEPMYEGLEFRVNNNKVTVLSKSLQGYPQFRDALGHLANIQPNSRRPVWVASIDSLCVGRECKSDKLVATVSLSTVEVK